LWIVAMTLAYSVTVLRSLNQLAQSIPFRTDLRWVAVLTASLFALLAIIGLVLLQLRYRTFPIMRLISAGMVLMGAVAIVLRQKVLSALIVVWLVLLGYFWAAWIFRRVGAKRSPDNGEWVAIACATGLALISLLPLLPGLTHTLTPRILLVILLVASLLQVRGMVRVALRVWSWVSERHWLPDPGDPERAILECLIAAIVVFNLCWALSPELSFDALNYQLAVPRFYLESHAIVELPYFWHSYFARLVNSLFLFCLGLGGPVACKLLMLTTGLITTLGVYALTCNLVSRRAAMWAAAFFYSTPFVSWLSTVSYIELTMTMFVITAWLAFMRWQEGRENAWLIASAILTGASIGAKPNGAFAFPVMGVAVLWLALRERPRARGIAQVTVFCISAVMVALPWYLLPWYWTGNPVFPLLNGVFKSPYWEPVNQMMNADQFGIGFSATALAKLPFLLTFGTQAFDELLRSGGLGIALVLLPVGVWLVHRRGKGGLLPVAIAAFFLLWAGEFQYARYLIPMLPMIVALSIGGVVEWAGQSSRRKYCVVALWVALLAQGALVLPPFDDIAVRNPLQLILHQRSEVEFLRRTLPPYKALEYLNSVTRPGDWVIAEDLEWLRFYVHAPMVSLRESRVFEKQLVWRDDKDLAARFSRAGYRYLIVNRPAVTRKGPYLEDSFLEEFATLEYNADSVEVYRLNESKVDRNVLAR
jgi:hypothetical protein